jgi:prepilin-type N-terminal cleavage/methylation domain-containing protein
MPAAAIDVRRRRYAHRPARLPSANHCRGFTLIELALGLFIVALILGSILVPLTTQVEQRKISDTRKSLDEIREALLGFAITNGRLPCPDTDNDPAAAGYGVEEAACAAAPVAEGFLPWKTLGVAEMDAFGTKRTAIASPRFGDWRYRVDRNFAIAFNLGTGFSADALVVRDSAAVNQTTTDERPLAIVFSGGPNLAPDGQNASFESAGGVYQSDVQSATFDDILIWISRPILFNRMVAAGRLP